MQEEEVDEDLRRIDSGDQETFSAFATHRKHGP